MADTNNLSVTAVAARVFGNIQDALVLGPQFPLRHVAALLGASRFRVNTRFGQFVLRPQSSDGAAFRQTFVERSYALPSAHQARLNARYHAILSEHRAPLIVDAGANVGAATRWFAGLYPEAAVVAVEPERLNLEILRENTSTLDRVRVVPAAIGAETGAVQLTGANDGTGWDVRTRRTSEVDAKLDPDSIQVVTIPELVNKATERLFIVKVDIEGFEADLFRCNVDWIDEVACIFVELHDWMLPDEHSSQAFQRALLGRGFDLLVIGENLAFVR